jgi:VanZ family protein
MPRWKDPRVVLAWLLFAGGAGFVLWLGNPDFSAANTGAWIRAILRFLSIDISNRRLAELHFAVRKSAHLCAYGGLSLLAFHALRVTIDSLPARLAAGALALTLAVAVTDEVHQTFTQTRTGTPRDVVIDGSAALAAVAIAIALRWRREARARAAATGS